MNSFNSSTPSRNQGTPSISLCMIAKNEEEMLKECLARVKPIVDEIILVDTGSTDKTKEIAKEAGAKLFEIPWENDFSQARNFSLKKANGEWILVLDADEFLSPRDLPKIRSLTNQCEWEGFRLCQRSYNDVLGGINWHPCRGEYEEERGHLGYVTAHLVRLFRNDPKIYFEGKVHEVVEKVMAVNGKKWASTEIPLHHYGFLRTKHRLKQKKSEYEKLGELKSKDMPDDPRALHDLGVQLIQLERFKDALVVLEKGFNLNPAWSPLLFNLGLVWQKLGNDDQAIHFYEQAATYDRYHQGALNNLGLLYQNRGQCEEAIQTYKRCLEKHHDYLPAILNMSTLLRKTKRSPEAVHYLERAKALSPSYSPLYRALALSYQDIQEWAAAEKCLEEWIGIDSDQELEARLRLADIQISKGDWDGFVQLSDLILQSLQLPRNHIIDSFHDLAELYERIVESLSQAGKPHLVSIAGLLKARLEDIARITDQGQTSTSALH